MKFATIDQKTTLAPCPWTAKEDWPEESWGIKWENIVTYPEDGMGFQLLEAGWNLKGRPTVNGWCLILGGHYVLPLFKTDERYAWIGDFSQTRLHSKVPPEEAGDSMKVVSLEIVRKSSELPFQQKLLLAGILPSYPPGFVGVPSVVLPKHFSRRATGEEAFYRFSAFPNDKRVDPGSGHFAPGTYAAPYSEIPLVPSGYAAVGRYALPSVFPCRHVFRNLPDDKTVLEIGAVQPNFGQAGGGVEVLFPHGAVNHPGKGHEIRES
jgi:hypothetical protein